MKEILVTARINRAKLLKDIEKLDWFIAYSRDLLTLGAERRDPPPGDQAVSGPETSERSDGTNPNVVWLRGAPQTCD